MTLAAEGADVWARSAFRLRGHWFPATGGQSNCAIGTSRCTEAIDRDRRRVLGTATMGIAVAGARSLLPSQLVAAPAGDAVRPFRINVPEETLIDLRRRLAATRWPDRETVGRTHREMAHNPGTCNRDWLTILAALLYSSGHAVIGDFITRPSLMSVSTQAA